MGGVLVQYRFPDRNAVVLAVKSDLRRVARETGRAHGSAPAYDDYFMRGRFSVYTVMRFVQPGTTHADLTWYDAMRAHGLKPLRPHKYELSRADMAQALSKAAALHGLPRGVGPSMRHFHTAKQQGVVDFSASVVKRILAPDGSWADALHAIGLKTIDDARRAGTVPWSGVCAPKAGVDSPE